jgi:acyl-CoA thioesterase
MELTTGRREHPFDVDTEVSAEAPGTYRAALSDRWGRWGGGPLGGYTVAVALQALKDAQTHPDPVTITAHFLRPGSPGAVTIDTELLKNGRRMSFGRAVLRQGDKPVLAMTAAFGDVAALAGDTQVYDAPPVMPPPGACRDPLDGLVVGDVSLAERIELRYATPVGWPEMRPHGQPTAELWVRLTGGREPDLDVLPLIVDAAPPVVLELGAPGSTTIELTVHLRRRPAPGWLACRVSTRHLINGMHEEDMDVWDSEGHFVAQSRQLALVTAPPTAADGSPTWKPPGP